jgi:hypothetical protein
MLYFIGTQDRIKIGISSNPFDRRSTIQTGNPDQCRLLLAIELLNDREIESLLHERLSFCRRSGEWFDISFASALDHLIALRGYLSARGVRELHLSSPLKPRLEDCHQEFEKWFRATYRPDGWNQQLHPLSYCWQELGEEFLRTRPKPN